MKKLLLSTFVVASLLSCTASRRITYLDIPQEKASSFEPVNVDSILAKYSGHDGVFLNSERTIEHFGTKGESAAQFLLGNFGLDWSFCDVEKYRYVVLNPEATWLTHVEYWSKPSQLYITITNPDSSVRRYGLAHLKEETEDGEKIYRLIFPDIQRGSLVEVGSEYTYSVQRYFPPLDHDIRLQFYIPCEKLRFSFAYPDWWKIKVKETGPSTKPTYEERSDPEKHKTIISYSATDIPAIPREPYSPFFKDVGNYLYFQVSSLLMGGNKVDRLLSWDDIAKEAYKKVIKPTRDGKSRYDIKKLAKEIVRGDTSKFEMMQAVVEYVRDSMEYTDNFGQADYHKAVKQKKGGLLELTGLVRIMLLELDIPASLLLIHSADDGYLDTSYADYKQFRLPAVRTEFDGKPYLLFPYLEYLPFDHTPQFVQGQQALVIEDDGKWEFWTVPRTDREDNSTSRDYRLTLSQDGNVTVEESGTLRGIMAYTMRKALSDMTDTEQEKMFKEFATFTGGDVSLKSHEIENPDDPGLPLIIKLNYDISNLLTVTPEEVIFHTGGLFAPISGNEAKFDPDNRQLPISIQADEQHDKNIEIVFPADWHLTTALSDVSMENVFGSIYGQYSIGDGELRINQRILLNHTFAGKEKYPELLELVGNPSLLYLPNLVFTVSDVTP